MGGSASTNRFLGVERAPRHPQPRPTTHEVLTRAQDRVVRVDFRFPGTNVVVEVLGYRYHRTHVQLERDASRMNALVADGFRVLQFTYATVVDDPRSMLDELRAALAQPVCVTNNVDGRPRW